MKEIIAKLNFDKKMAPATLAQISMAKNSGDPGRYFDKTAQKSHIKLIDIYEIYKEELLAKNAVDFDDILFLTRNLLRDHDDLRLKYCDSFDYILVDEFQDSNNLQEELTGLLLGNNNLFCVGDDWQAIYGFRGSNVNHFMNFDKKYENARIFRLEQNFRSSDEIVQVANDLIGFNQDRMDKRCFSEKRGGVVELHDFFNESQEAGWVGDKVLSFRQMGVPLDKMAVLYRTKACSLAFEKTFRYRGIPYRMMGSKGFFERKEILDITCYLAAATFPKDDVAFDRIINIPKRGIGPAMLKKIGNVRTGDMSLQEATRKVVSERILTPKVHDGLIKLFGLIDEIKNASPDNAIRIVLDDCGYLEYLKHYSKTEVEFDSRMENIEELMYTASKKETLIEYLEEASLVRDDKNDDDNDSGIGLSTIHASKGLEYQVVFVVGCEETLFPHWRSMESETELQEERRLMYVAVTRSERFLFLSSVDYRRDKYYQRSRFLDEIDESL